MPDIGTADTSSYTKPPALPVQKSALEIAGQLGSLQQQKLQIDTQKLNNANQALGYMTRAMGALGPNATKDQYISAATTAAKMGLVPPESVQTFAERAAAAPTSQDFYNEFMTAAADHQQQINYHLGSQGEVSNGQQVTPVVSSVKPGFGVRPNALPIQQQAPPGTQTVNENNQPQALGAQSPQLPAGAVPAGTLPGQFRTPLPAERPTPAISGPTGPTIDRTPATPTTFANRFPTPQGPVTGVPPLFNEGKEAYTKDQLAASVRAQSIKPAIQALKLMPGLSTGPGTSQFTDLVAAAKAWGIVDTKAENDPTVLRQELTKKLAQYVGSSPLGQRSDAQQALAEAGSPDPKKQILPALQALTRDAIALDRVGILKPQAFKGQDYQNYIKHQGTFPGSIDEKALTLDMLPEKERSSLVTKMATQYKNGDAGEKKVAGKFLETLKLAKEHGIFEGM